MSRPSEPWSLPWHDLQRQLAAGSVASGIPSYAARVTSRLAAPAATWMARVRATATLCPPTVILE